MANYTGHDWDSVLRVYFAQARVYDAGDRRFGSRDPAAGSISKNITLNIYIYCVDNPMGYVDAWGLSAEGYITKLYINGSFHSQVNAEFPYYPPDSLLAKFAAPDSLLKENNPGFYARLVASNNKYTAMNDLIQSYSNQGFSNQISEWFESKGVKIININTDMRNSSFQLVRKGNQVIITAYVDFQGDSLKMFENGKTYADVIEQGFKMWGGNYEPKDYYDQFGCYSDINVSVNIVRKGNEQINEDQEFFALYFTAGELPRPKGMPEEVLGAYNPSPKTMILSSQYNNVAYSADVLQGLAAHEFGPVLSLREAYPTDKVKVTDEIPRNDVMREARLDIVSGKYEFQLGYSLAVTPNDIEMVLDNWFHGYRPGFYANPGNWEKSPVIRQ